MQHVVFVVVVALLSMACVTPASTSPSPDSSPAGAQETLAATAAASPASSQPTTPVPTSEAGGDCPQHSPLSLAEYTGAVAADPGCFAGGDVAIIGWAGTWPEGIGWLAPGIEPAWLALSTAAIWAEKCPTSTEGCGEDMLPVHVDPQGEFTWKQDGRWVVITGHKRDPRADTCAPEPPDNGISEGEAQDQCRRAFVVTSVRKAATALSSGSFARIVIPELNVRVLPSTSAAVLQEGHPDASPTEVRFGTASGVDSVYVLDGPVSADGYRWWLVSATEYVLDISASGTPDIRPIPSYHADDNVYTGWVADGGGRDAWLLPENPCPVQPVDTADLSGKAASWAIGLGCFGGQTMTLRGWNDGGNAIFPVKRTWDDPENHDRLNYRVDPATLANPAAGQWFEIRGQFDHPSASTCPSEMVLECRAAFTATALVGLGP